ncbi:hypothetical protein AB0K34_10970 [Actinomadura sp. NPDC049382]|uniref:hypothetical protein n=1 Tax=Actinomadura sp. NPDC049382 TaxID=3158220 RepID=UPI003446AA37
MAVLANLLVKIGIDADRVDQGLGRVGGFFEKHGAKMAAAGGALGAAGGVALVQGLQAGMEKEALGDKLAAQLGATGPEAARLGKVAGNVYSQGLGEGLDQVHDAVGAVVSSIDGMRGASDKAVQSMTTKALNLAKAYEIDVNRSMQVVGQAVRTGLVKNASEGVDLLAATLQKVPANVREDVVDAIDEYSPYFEALGIKGQDAFNLLVKASEKGAFGLDKTSDALAEFLKRATDMGSATGQVYKDLGLNQKKMTADLLAGGDRGAAAFQKIIGGLRGIKDPTDQSQAAIALFGTQLEDIGLENIPGFLASLDSTQDKLGDTAGAADRLGQTLNDNAATGIESWKRKTEGALASLANTNGVMGDTAQAATGITQALAPMGADLGGLALTALVAGKGISGFASKAGGALKTVGSGIGTAASTVGRGAAQIAASAGRAALSVAKLGASVVATGARMAATAAMAAGRVVAAWALMGLQALLNAAKMALSWVIAFWPVLLVVALVAVVVALIIKYWDQIVKFFTTTLPAWLRAGFNFIISVIKWGAKVGFFGPVGLIIAHWGKIKTFFTQTVPAALRAFGSFVVSIIKKAAQYGFLGPVGLIIAHWTRIKNFFMVTLPNGVKAGATRVVGFMRSLPGRIRSALGNLGGLLVQAGRNVVQGLINGITSRFGALASKAHEMASKIRNVLPFSPAKEGPLSGRGSPERAGRKIGAMVAAGMDRSTGAVAAAAAGMAGAAAVNAGGMGAAGINAVTPAGVRAAAAGGLPPIVIKGDGSHIASALIELLRAAIAESGGDVQKTLGRS